MKSKLLITLRDEDIFPLEFLAEIPDTKAEKQRVKGIIRDKDNKIAIAFANNRVLPGGGVEPEDKSLEDALKRECMEEIGCNVEVVEEIGHSDEYRMRSKEKQPSHQTIHCFVGDVVGEKGTPTSTQDDEQGLVVEWYAPDDAIAMMEEQLRSMQPVSGMYHMNFNVRSQLVFLKEYKKRYG